MITDIKYLESQFSDELAEELNKSSKDDDTNVDAIIAEIMGREGTILTNVFDTGRNLVNDAFALQEKGDNINYTHPMGNKIVANGRSDGEKTETISGDAIDVEVKNTLETFDIKKNKLLLESKNIVEDYNDFIECHFKKNITDRSGHSGTPSYAMYFKYFNGDVSTAVKHGISDSELKREITSEYHQMDDPDKIRQVVQMRIKYIEGVNAILKEMIKTNGQLLGLDEQQIDALIKGLSSDETSGKTIGEIKDIVVKNKSKFIKQNGTILDLRPLGAGVFIGSDKDPDFDIEHNEDKLKTAIQQCLTYDLVLNAHGDIGKKPLMNSNGKDVKYYADFYRFSREAIKKDVSAVIKMYEKMVKGNNRYHITAEGLADDIAHAIKDGKATYIVMKIKDKSPNADIWSAMSYDSKSINITLNMPYDLAFKEMVVYRLLRYMPKSIDDDVSINDFSAITKKIYCIFIKYLKLKSQADDGTFDYHYSNIDGNVIGGGDKWQFNIKYLDGKTYTSIKDVLKMAKSKGFDKILLSSCNVGYFEKPGLGGPDGFDLPKDLTRNVTFAKNPIWKETYIDNNYVDYYNESVTENDIYVFLNDFENDYRAIAESYNIDYDNDQVLNEMYNYVISGQYLAETTTLHEGKLADVWHKIVEFIKKAIGFIIKLVKMFIDWIKGIIDKIKERFGKKKKVKINKSPVKASFISVEGDSASLTSEKEVSSYDELKEMINNVMARITKIFRKNSDEQVRLQNSLKNECERAANKQSSIGEAYLLNEAMLKSAKDIYHNKDKFKSGETNLCFITGLSGSGKSSMGTAMVKGAKNIEHYDMDDIVFNKQNHDMNYYKNYGDLVYKFFSGPGQKYFVTFKEIKSSLNTSEDNYRKEITNAFVDFAISYAKSHKNTKFIVEGVWLYRYVSPNKLKDYAVCIKGTSAATSMMRAAKRDNDYIGKFKKGTVWVGDEMKLNKYRTFYKNSTDENDSDSTGAIKESRTIFGITDNMELMYMSCYEAYLYNTINNESRLTEALINECGLHESTIMLEADLKQEAKSKWETFINFINRMIDRFNVAMDKILYGKIQYLEDNKNVILNTPWRDDIPYEYEGDYDEAVDRVMNTKCPVFNYERDARSLRQEGYTEAIKVFMAGAGFKYTDDKDIKMEDQFKNYFLAKDHGKKNGKLSDLKPQKIYNFCYNRAKIDAIIKADSSALTQSTNIILNAINKERRERGEDVTKPSNMNSQASVTGNGGSTTDNNKPGNATPATGTTNPQQNISDSFLWININEAGGEQQSPTGTSPAQTSGGNQNTEGSNKESSSGKTGLTIGNNSPVANDKDTENAKTDKNDTTKQDIDNILTKWTTLCRCLITSKLTAVQQISHDYMAFITAHVNSVNGESNNKEQKQDNNQQQPKQDQNNNQTEEKK